MPNRKPDPILARDVCAVIEREGILHAVEILGACRESITRIAAGLAVRQSTLATVRASLGREAAR